MAKFWIESLAVERDARTIKSPAAGAGRGRGMKGGRYSAGMASSEMSPFM